VDNFLKIVKTQIKAGRKFQGQGTHSTLFKAMANIRNFVPFMSGAKNVGKKSVYVGWRRNV